MALSDGLVGLWSPFMGASGYRLLDRSGRGNHGTLTNMDAGTDWVGATVNGRSGYALDFDGSNDCVELPSVEPLQSIQVPLTISSWVYKSSGSNGSVLSQYKNISSNQLVKIAAFGTTEFAYYASTSTGGFQRVAYSSVPALNKWHFLTWVVSGSISTPTCRIGLNGVEESFSLASLSSNPDTTVPLRIACTFYANQNTEFNQILISELCIWNRALSTSEVINAYLTGPGWYGRQSTRVYGFVPASGTTGTLSATLAAATLASSSTLANGASGDLSKALDSATLSSSATLADGLSASLAATLDNATLSSSADVVDGASGSLSATLGNASVSSSATLEDGLTASLSKTLDDATLSASGAESIGLAGDLSATLDAATLSSSATLADGLNGSLSASLSDATLSSSATLADGATGSVSATLDSCTVSSSGSFGAGLTAELNAALDSATVSSSGTLANGLTANLSVQLASATLAASGSFFTPAAGTVMKIRIGGVWRDATPYVKAGGVWREATPYIKVNGEWK